ncbi:hypothetical protein Lalb_Chr01g0016321 [Lupinus albus]|uniref:Uncharacterized protein n=1 Tax=Lupinus albus TaxID=3870 RepID=A0A6A4R848_LUPAL|nr:hypothetical protein Lalb_Chr01g0016321 [Lupinus albus]
MMHYYLLEQLVVSSSTSTGNLQCNSEKVEFIVKSAAPNVDVPSSSTNESRIDNQYAYCDYDDNTTYPTHHDNDNCIAQDRAKRLIKRSARYIEVII